MPETYTEEARARAGAVGAMMRSTCRTGLGHLADQLVATGRHPGDALVMMSEWLLDAAEQLEWDPRSESFGTSTRLAEESPSLQIILNSTIRQVIDATFEMARDETFVDAVAIFLRKRAAEFV